MKTEVIEAALHLFNAVPKFDSDPDIRLDKNVVYATMSRGFMFNPSVPNWASERIIDIAKVVGISGEDANKTLHKEWYHVRYSDMAVLIAEQVVHYISTYGFNRLFGLTEGNEKTIYLPSDLLMASEFTGNMPLTQVFGMTPAEILDGIIKLGGGIALHKDTLDRILVLIHGLGLPLKDSDLNKIKNRELKTKLYKYYKLVPKDPTDWLRYALEELIGSTLLIRDSATIESLKMVDPKKIDKVFATAPAPKALASIFLRYKPLFLAMKRASTNKYYFNRLRRLADRMHRPIKQDCLSTLTDDLRHNRVKFSLFREKLAKASFFRKARILNALLYEGEYKAYRIRNGRIWVKPNDKYQYGLMKRRALEVLYESLVAHLGSVKDQFVYIPEGIDYGVPTSEKSYIGPVPNNTVITVPGDMIIGVYWKNVDHHQTDLDLSLVNINGKIGWDRGYRSARGKVLFSGDITDAPDGATELFLIGRDCSADGYTLNLNYYNFNPGRPVPTKVLIGKGCNEDEFSKGYMIEPENIIASVPIVVDQHQNCLGVVSQDSDVLSFIMTNAVTGRSISSRETWVQEGLRAALVDQATSSARLSQLLELAGAKVVREKVRTPYIDLSLQALDKTTILDLIDAG